MMESKKTNFKRIITYYILIMVCALIIAFLTQYIFAGTNLFEGLGILPSDKCIGSFSITNSGCTFKAKISLNGCLENVYKVREDSCMGQLKCEGTIDYDSTQTTCGWKDSSGSHNYVLCVSNKVKDSTSKTC